MRQETRKARRKEIQQAALALLSPAAAAEMHAGLAEALVERKGLKERLDKLKVRLAVNARVQEGDTPTETPETLLAQVDYVFYGPLEREADPAPGWDAGLRLLEPFDPSDPYRVYEVLRRD